MVYEREGVHIEQRESVEPITQVKEGEHFPGAGPSTCVNSRGGMENGYKWVQLSAGSGGEKLTVLIFPVSYKAGTPSQSGEGWARRTGESFWKVRK